MGKQTRKPRPVKTASRQKDQFWCAGTAASDAAFDLSGIVFYRFSGERNLSEKYSTNTGYLFGNDSGGYRL